MELEVPVKKENNKKAKLKLLNCFLNNLTDVELDIVSTMLNKGYTILDSDNRAEVRSTLNMTKYNFNNYTKRLVDKGIFILNPEKVIILHPRLKILTNDDTITIRFAIHEE